ncbi:MAG: N-acetylmuramoyl-L-alanine amidase [Terriglobales bacterium]
MATVALALTLVTALPAAARRSVAQKKQAARSQFEKAERMREALNGRAASERTRRDYKRVLDAYQSVYFTAPTSNKADVSVVAVAELWAEMGRQFRDQKASQSAIEQYEFLRREYPGSRYRVQALFTIAQIYEDDLEDAAQARAGFEEFLKRYPHSDLAGEARDAIKALDQQAKEAAKPKQKAKSEEAKAPVNESGTRTLVTGIRHWSTPDYTRVAIDLGDEVKYDTGRVPDPDRVFFDLHNTKLSSTLVGKTFDVEDGLLKKVRVAQYQAAETRVVLEMDEVSDYSAFLLPNPYRLIIDIHSKRPQKLAKTEPPKAPADKPVTKPAPAPAAPVEMAKTAPPAKLAVEPKREVKPEIQKPETRPAAESKTAPEQVAKLTPPEVPASKPSGGSDAAIARSSKAASSPSKRSKAARQPAGPPVHTAEPTASGERSLVRALGLKIGRIVVDAGHGGHDTGTIGPNGLQEKDLVLDVALRLGKLLENRMGAEVVYTRDDDTFIPLETRTAIANQNEADLFISIHANSSRDPGARGIETYYLNFTTSADALEVAARENAVSDKSIHELQDLVKKIALKDKIEESREFAGDVQQSLYSGLAVRGMKNRGVKKAPFIVLIGANMPSILAEISFVSNPADAKKLKTADYRQKIAESLYRGCAKYVSGLSGLKVASKVARPEPPTASAPASSSQ